MGAAIEDTLLLLSPVLRRRAPLAKLDVEAHTPAAAPDAIVRLDEKGESVLNVEFEQFDCQIPFKHDLLPHGGSGDKTAGQVQAA